mgnify:FL=1|jgi:hypothetical protein
MRKWPKARTPSGHFAFILALVVELVVIMERSACSGRDSSAMRRPGTETFSGSLLVVLAAPKTVFSALSAGVATLFCYGAASAVGPS